MYCHKVLIVDGTQCTVSVTLFIRRCLSYLAPLGLPHIAEIHFGFITIFTRPWPAFAFGLVGLSGGYTSHASPCACGARLGRKVSRNGRNAISPIYRHLWKVSRNGRNVISPIYSHFWKVSRSWRNAICPVYRHFWKVSRSGRNAISPVCRHFWKVSRNGRTRFFLFLDTFCRFSCF